MTFIILRLSRSHSFPTAGEPNKKERGRKGGPAGDTLPPVDMAAEAGTGEALRGNTAARARNRPPGRGRRRLSGFQRRELEDAEFQRMKEVRRARRSG